MVIQGKSLIISSGGEALAASKSCDINVQVKTIETAPQTNGQWEESIAGRKSWSITTNHLVLSKNVAKHTLQAISESYASQSPTRIIIDGVINQNNIQTRGVAITVYNFSNAGYVLDGTSVFDTYDSAAEQGAAFITMLTNVAAGAFVVVTSADALSITSDMRTALLTAFPNLNSADIPLFSAVRGAFVLIGKKASHAVCAAAEGEDKNVHVTMLADSLGNPLTDAMIKDMVAKVGATYALKVQTEGFALDVLRGSAICQSCRITATLGNLLQGSFSFKGSGPLQ